MRCNASVFRNTLILVLVIDLKIFDVFLKKVIAVLYHLGSQFLNIST